MSAPRGGTFDGDDENNSERWAYYSVLMIDKKVQL